MDSIFRMLRIGLSLAVLSTGAFSALGQGKAKSTNVFRDPVGQPFRLAPMPEAVRTVAIPLAEDVHIAFDTALLRTHLAWVGPSLNINGSPYRGQKVPFYCSFEGEQQWATPQFFSWAVGPAPGILSEEMPKSARYRGLSSKGGKVTLLYELGLEDGEKVMVHETPRVERIQGKNMIVRRLEIAPSKQDLWFLAHVERDVDLKSSDSDTATLIRKNGERLSVQARGVSGLVWETRVQQIKHEAKVWREKKNDSELLREDRSGLYSQAWLKIPAHEEAVAIEVASVAIKGSEFPPLSQGKVKQPDLEFVSSDAMGGDPEPKVIKEASAKGPRRASGNKYYRVEHFALPKSLELQVTGLDFLPNGDLAVCTWLGEIYIIKNADGKPGEVTYHQFATGLCEPGGLKVIDGEIYVVQKVELTRVLDTDGNGTADWFDCINQDWGATGNYHDFSFGPLLDAEKNFYVYRTGNRGVYEMPYMGWAVKISPDGSKLEGVASGFRSPNGFGKYKGDLFMADNQGNYVGTCTLHHVKKGGFFGFPSTTPSPKTQFNSPDRKDPPAIWFPYKLSASTSDIKEIPDDRFGPFKGQLVIGDWKNANIMRATLEKVNGEWQGCVWPMAKGFWSGVNRFAFGEDGKLYVGGCKNRAWAALGPYESSLDRVSWTGKVPFEVKDVHAKPDGFELVFTQPVDKETAEDIEAYDVMQYTYLFQQKYGSPEVDHDGKEGKTYVDVTSATVSNDRLKVRLKVDGWKPGYVTMIRPLDVENDEGDLLWNDTFYYTLNSIPKK